MGSKIYIVFLLSAQALWAVESPRGFIYERPGEEEPIALPGWSYGEYGSLTPPEYDSGESSLSEYGEPIRWRQVRYGEPRAEAMEPAGHERSMDKNASREENLEKKRKFFESYTPHMVYDALRNELQAHNLDLEAVKRAFSQYRSKPAGLAPISVEGIQQQLLSRYKFNASKGALRNKRRQALMNYSPIMVYNNLHADLDKLGLTLKDVDAAFRQYKGAPTAPDTMPISVQGIQRQLAIRAHVNDAKRERYARPEASRARKK